MDGSGCKYFLFMPIASFAAFSCEAFHYAYFCALSLGLRGGNQRIDVLNKEEFVELLSKSLKEAARRRYTNSLKGCRDYDYPQFGCHPQVGVAPLGKPHEATKEGAFRIMAQYQDALCDLWDAREKYELIKKIKKNPEQYLKDKNQAIASMARLQIEINELTKKTSQPPVTLSLKGREATIGESHTQMTENKEKLALAQITLESLISQYQAPLEAQVTQAVATMQTAETQWNTLRDESLVSMQPLAEK